MAVENIEQERLSRLEGTYDQVDRRLDDMHQSLEGLRTETNSRFNEMSSRMENQFNILIVVMVGAWVTLMAAIIARLLK